MREKGRKQRKQREIEKRFHGNAERDSPSSTETGGTFDLSQTASICVIGTTEHRVTYAFDSIKSVAINIGMMKETN